MVEVTIEEDRAVFAVQGADRLWALKSRLEIPLRHIRGARRDPEIAHGWWKGFRAPGTHVPGVIVAGTFYQDGKRIFWDVHEPANTIVVELADERYDEIIVEVADPAATLEALTAAVRSARSTP